MHKYLLTYQDIFIEFIETEKARSMTFHLWNEYIIDVEIAFDYICAEKTPNWNMHISAFAEMLWYAFTYDHQNYSPWGPLYIAEMLLLPETAPEVSTKFQEGEHVVKRSENRSFNTVWFDLGLEQSVVKDSKSGKGGIIGCSRENTGTTKWYLKIHEGAAIVRNLKRMCEFNDYEEIIHRDMIPLAIKESEKNVETINFCYKRKIW